MSAGRPVPLSDEELTVRLQVADILEAHGYRAESVGVLTAAERGR